MVALTTLGEWGTIAAARAHDSHLITHVSGHRMALARYLNEGTLYPPLHDGGHYGGTRIMPLSIILHASAARLTGEYLTSAKLLSGSTMLALAASTGGVLWRLGCPLAIAAILATTVLIINPGYRVGLSGLSADVLPVLLQLLAVSIVAATRRRMSILLGAVLSSLAFMTKFSALWAPLAIAIWLAFTNRTRLWLFASTYVVVVASLLAAVTAASNARFWESFLGLWLAGTDGVSALLHSPTHLVRILFSNTPALWSIVPVALLGVAVSFARRRPSICDLGLLCHLPLLVLIFADIGADANHLLDLSVLSVLAIGHVVANGPPHASAPSTVARAFRRHRLTVMQGVAALFAIWITATHVVIYVPDVHLAVAAMAAGDTARHKPLARWISANNRILSEDPYVPVALGQRPVVSDPFMLLRIGNRHPEAAQALIRRIENREFDFVVLLAPVERTWWWERFHFGRSIIDSIDRAYDFSVGAEGYYLYTPARE